MSNKLTQSEFGGFAGVSSITLANGETKRLYDLEPGDKVKCVNSNGEFVEDEISTVEIRDNQSDIFVVGNIICQRKTRFYNPDKKDFTISVELRGNDESSILSVINGKLVKIPNVIRRKNPLGRSLYYPQTKNDNMIIIEDIVVK